MNDMEKRAAEIVLRNLCPDSVLIDRDGLMYLQRQAAAFRAMVEHHFCILDPIETISPKYRAVDLYGNFMAEGASQVEAVEAAVKIAEGR